MTNINEITNDNSYTILHGDCLDRLKELPDNSVDSVCTDPPYGLSKEPDIAEVLTKWVAGEPYDHGHGGFMGKAWDSFVPHPDIWTEVHRVLKPGGHALVFAGTRTQDLMTVSLRLAGFEVRDVIEWIYFSGFPKSHNVGKAFDRRAGAEREVVGRRTDGRYAYGFKGNANKPIGNIEGDGAGFTGEKGTITAPATELARKWDGWGTALKPAHEPIIVVRKPLSVGGRKATVADNVEEYGTGAINVDASRIATEDDLNGGAYAKDSQKDVSAATSYGLGVTGKEFTQPEGRFPANCITLDSDEFYSKYFNIAQANVSPQEVSKKASKGDRNSDWQGEEITLESRRAGALQGRNDGSLGSVTFNRNTHPTVKPIDLMAWLVRLVTPPNGTVLDPFAGSGSTAVAAKREGFGFVAIEREAEYIEIIKARTHEKAVNIEKETV